MPLLATQVAWATKGRETMVLVTGCRAVAVTERAAVAKSAVEWVVEARVHGATLPAQRAS